MAIDPRTREALLAGWGLNRFRSAEELRQEIERLEKKLHRRLAGTDQLIQRIIEKKRDLCRSIAPGIVPSGSVSGSPAAMPATGEPPTMGKPTAPETTPETTDPRPALLRVPDVVQVITAYRAWRTGRVGGQVRLFALGVNVVWEPRQQAEAECKLFGPLAKLAFSSNEPRRRNHEAPHFHCQCGIWGFKSLENLLSALVPNYKPSVIGKVSLWGRVIETENGFRAQYAYPEQLWPASDSPSCEEAGLIYGVPVRTPQPEP
jgi:hypothetical protein